MTLAVCWWYTVFFTLTNTIIYICIYKERYYTFISHIGEGDSYNHHLVRLMSYRPRFLSEDFRLGFHLKIDFRVEYRRSSPTDGVPLHTPFQPKRYIRSLNVWLLQPRRIWKTRFSYIILISYLFVFEFI